VWLRWRRDRGFSAGAEGGSTPVGELLAASSFPAGLIPGRFRVGVVVVGLRRRRVWGSLPEPGEGRTAEAGVGEVLVVRAPSWRFRFGGGIRRGSRLGSPRR
jgi:hypothetical protein